jgi:hypothetical protein
MGDLEGGSNDGITHPVYDKTMSCMLKTLLHINNLSCNNDKEEDQSIRLLPLPRGECYSSMKQ